MTSLMQAEFIKRIASLRQCFTRERHSSIGIDIGSGVLKVVEISWNKNVASLKAASLVMLPADLVQDGIIMNKKLLSETLHQLLISAGVTGKRAVISVSGYIVFMRVLTFPVMSAAELRQAIAWDLETYIPAGAEAYYFDFAIIGAGSGAHEIRVLLVAAPHSFINDVTAIAKATGLKLMAIDIEPLALCRAARSGSNSLFVDIGHRIYQLTFFQNNCPVVSRLIPLSGQQQPMIVIEQLSHEIQRTIDYYQIQERQAVIEGVILTGGGARMDKLAINLATRLTGLEVTLIDPLAGLAVARSLDPEWLQCVAPQLSVAIGLALRGGEGY